MEQNTGTEIVMQSYKNFDLYKEFARLSDSPCLLLTERYWDNKEMEKTIPYLNEDQVFELSLNGSLFLRFENIEDALCAYNSTVGKYGSTKLNDYRGEAQTNAFLFFPNGVVYENV